MELINMKKYKELKKVLKIYRDLLTEMDRVRIDKQILQAYVYDKSLTCIEIEHGKYESVLQLVEKLGKFFFVLHAPYKAEPEINGYAGDIFITRFKNVYEIVKSLVDKDIFENKGLLSRGFVDKYADLFGILFGYTHREVALYCLKAKLNLTGIKFRGRDYERILQFIKRLEENFYTNQQIELSMEGKSSITYFKNVYETIRLYTKNFDKYADLQGILVGINPREVARFCLEGPPKIFNLIK